MATNEVKKHSNMSSFNTENYQHINCNYSTFKNSPKAKQSSFLFQINYTHAHSFADTPEIGIEIPTQTATKLKAYGAKRKR